jgi:hypothetical protein
VPMASGHGPACVVSSAGRAGKHTYVVSLEHRQASFSESERTRACILQIDEPGLSTILRVARFGRSK